MNSFPGATKPEILGASVRTVEVAGGGATEPAVVVEGASAHCMERRSPWTTGISPRTAAIVALIVPIRCPLPNVAEHVVQSVSVRQFHPHFVRAAAAVKCVPGDGVHFV